MSSGYINLPSVGSGNWKSPVAITSSLPTTGNSVGDIRLAEDTNTIYVWNGSAWIAVATPGAAIAIDGLIGDVLASGPGVVTATIASHAVTNAKFRQSVGLSLVGRSTSTTGDVADITAASDHQVLRRSGTSIGFGSIDLSQSNAVGTSILGVANGGTGSATQNFVDLTTNQSIGGIKTFTNTTDSTLTTNGAVIVSGGVGIAKSVNIGGGLDVTDFTTAEGGISSPGLAVGGEVFGAGADIGATTNSLAIGNTATTTADNSVVIGTNATTITTDSIAIGYNVNVAGVLQTVIGSGASASGFGQSVVLGQGSSSTGTTCLVLGQGSSDGGFTNVNVIGATTTATANAQTILSNCNTLIIGKPTQTGAVGSKTVNITERTGTNVNAATSISILGPRGTGTGTTGSIFLTTYQTGTTGSTPHVLGTAGLTITGTQRAGIFQTSPTALLHIGAGTATANTAPLKFTAGTNLTSPEAGAMEYDGKNFWLTRLSTRRKISVSNDEQTTSTTVASTTTETTIFTMALPANGTAVGDTYRINLGGYYSTANGTDTFTLRYKIGATTILSMTSDASNVTNAPFHAEIFATVRSIGASGSIIGHATIDSNNVGHDTSNTTTTTVDTTATQTYTVTVQWSAASASNTFTQTIGFDEIL